MSSRVLRSITGAAWRALRGLAALVPALLAAQLPGAPAGAATAWELLSPFAAGDFETRNLEQFASEVEQATDGALKIVVLADPERFSSREVETVVASGRAPAGEFLLSELSAESAAFEVDMVPFLATDYDQALALWDASRPVLEPMLEARGLRLAFVVARPPRGLFVDRQIWTMQDLRGLRVLDDGAMTRRLAVLAGAMPTERTPGPLEQAFATKRIDAAFASLPEGAAEKAWTFVPYYYDLRVALPKSVVAFNRAAYRALDAEVQRAILNAAVAAQNRGWQASGAGNNEAIDLMRARGMTIATPEPQVASGLREIGTTMTDEWARRAGADGQHILRAYAPQRASGR